MGRYERAAGDPGVRRSGLTLFVFKELQK